MTDLPYRYRIVYEVIVAGDGQHQGGDGAMATRDRLQDALAADRNVVEVRPASIPAYMPRLSNDE